MGDSGTPTASTAIDTLDPDSWGCQTLPHGFARNESMFPAIRLGYIWDPKTGVHTPDGPTSGVHPTSSGMSSTRHPPAGTPPDPSIDIPCEPHHDHFWDPKLGGPSDG